jgi:hypothetical protein
MTNFVAADERIYVCVTKFQTTWHTLNCKNDPDQSAAKNAPSSSSTHDPQNHGLNAVFDPEHNGRQLQGSHLLQHHEAGENAS